MPGTDDDDTEGTMPEIPEIPDLNEGQLHDSAPVESPEGAAESPEVAELRRRCDELDQTVSQLKDQLLRKAAEFDNYRKRTDAESVSVIRFANEDLLLIKNPAGSSDGENIRSVHGFQRVRIGQGGEIDGLWRLPILQIEMGLSHETGRGQDRSK